jgi:type II secretory pathway component PulF
MRTWQRLVVAAYTVLGLVGLAWLFNQRHPAALFFLAILLGFPVINIFVQASARYRFPIDWALLVLGCKFLLDQFRRLCYHRV